MIGAIITVLFILAVVYLAYRRLPLLSFTAAFTVLLLAYAILGNPAGLWLGLLVILLLCFWLLNLRPLRIVLISGPFMKTYRRLLPSMSDTDRKSTRLNSSHLGI